MAVNFFLKIDSIPGEATVKYAEKHIDIESVSFGVSQPGGAGVRGAGLTTGKAVPSEVSFTKRADKASAMLFKTACWGTHLPTAVFTSYKANGQNTPLLYWKVTLTDVVISHYQTQGSEASELGESLGFTYSKIEFEYTEMDNKGNKGAVSNAEFSVTEGSAA